MRKYNLIRHNDKTPVKYILLLVVFTFFVPHLAQAAQANFNWYANPSGDNVLGYNLYFGEKTSCEQDAPCAFNGTSSTKGVSPIDVTLDDLDDPENPSYILDGLDEGSWCFRLTAYNANGESAPGDTLTQVIDTINPSVSITNPTTESTYITNNSTVKLSGTASDNVCIGSITWINDQGGSGIASGTTSWSQADVTLYSGVNVITLTAYDAAGNTGTDTLTVTYTPPNTPPAIDSYLPSSSTPSVNEGSSLAFSVTASDVDDDSLSYSWKLDGSEVSTVSSYTYSPDYSASGSHTVVVSVSDGTAQAAQTWNVTVNDKAAITITKGAVSTSTRFVKVSIIDTNGEQIVAWLLSENNQDPAPLASDSRWVTTKPTSYKLTSPNKGTKVIYLWLKDASGNVSADSVSDSIDLTPLGEGKAMEAKKPVS